MVVVGCARDNPLFGASDDGGAEPTAGDGGTSGETSGGTRGATGSDTGDGSGGQSGVEDDGSADGGQVEFVDDEWRGEFGAGQQEGLVWSEDHLELSPEVDEGYHWSRIFDAGSEVEWLSIHWRPLAPYGKPLPDGGDSEEDYAHSNADMQDVRQLLHLDGRSVDAWKGEVPDTSGLGHHATFVGEGGFSLVQGVFGQALRDEAQLGHVDLDADAFEPGTSDFTWAFWYRADSCSVNDTVIAFDSPSDVPDTPSVWLLCCAGGHVGYGAYSGPQGGMQCAERPLADGEWHHLALVKEGHSSAQVRLHYDGAVVVQDEYQYDEPFLVIEDVELTLGGTSDEPWLSQGDFDEVAIFHRALSPDEIKAMFSRGVNLLRLRARACDDAMCSTEPPFLGPEGMDDRAFEDGIGPGPDTAHPLDLVGRYVQYEVAFTSRDPAAGTPELAIVGLRGQ